MKHHFKRTAVGLLAVILAGCSSTSPATSTNESTETTMSLTEQFKNPDMRSRPLTRWWVPGSMMDEDEVKKEIESMVNAGFGGAEIVPVSIAGGDGDGEIDWGSDHWKEITKYILQTAGEYDFTIDFTMTPAWPLALPGITDVDDPEQGAQMEADGAHIDVKGKAGSEIEVTLPVSEEAVEDAENVNGTVQLAGVTVAKYADSGDNTLVYSSARALDLDDVETDADGNQTIPFTPEEDGNYLVYAWYQHPAGNTKYGNIQLDHFSSAATEELIDYWETNLIPYYGDDWANVRSLFIDSLEFETQLDWTYNIQSDFEDMFGYDITPYLAGIYDDGTPWVDNGATGNYMGAADPAFTFDENEDQINNDWHEFLTQIYEENHVKPLAEFCEEHGVTLRYQTSYGKDMEVGQTALYPDIPETESLYGDDHTDFYRLQAGAVHAADKSVYSMETAAEWTETWNPKKENGEYGTRGNGEKNSGNYEQTFLDHIWHDQRAFATGVNQLVFHGYPYNGAYDGDIVEGTQWPGFTGFESYRWSNSWGERQPNWMYASTYLDYLTRNQFILRQGTAKTDVAIYHHTYNETIDFLDPENIFDSDVLEKNGYSYEFVSPALFELDNMTVTDGVLDSEGAAYQALIINQEEELPAETVKKLIDYAENGLQIIFVGTPASQGFYSTDADITADMDTLLDNGNVTVVDTEDDTLAALQDAEITPAASYEDAYLLVNHRQDSNHDYYYIYNEGNTDSYPETREAETVNTEVTLQGEGKPYLFNAWTGDVTAISDYTENDGSVTVSVNLVPNDSRIIVVTNEELAEPVEEKTVISDEVEIDGWNLSVESWTKGETVLDTVKTEIEVGDLDELKTWDKIDGLEDVSGIGTYTASFTMPDSFEEGESAYIHLGNIKDAFGLKINGQEITVDQCSRTAEIGAYLKSGENDIEVTIATALLNAILKENSSILNEDGRVLDDRSRDSYGMTGTIAINGDATGN